MNSARTTFDCFIMDRKEEMSKKMASRFAIPDLTQEELDRLCDFIELLDRWDREHKAKLSPSAEPRDAPVQARHNSRRVPR